MLQARVEERQGSGFGVIGFREFRVIGSREFRVRV